MTGLENTFLVAYVGCPWLELERQVQSHPVGHFKDVSWQGAVHLLVDRLL